MNNSPQKKTILSLSSIMFFALLIRKWFKDWDIRLEAEDKEFVLFYLQLWLINTVLLLFCIAFFLLGFTFKFPLFSSIGNWIFILLISIVFIELFLVIFNYHGSLTAKQYQTFSEWSISHNKLNVIKNFMPFYTIYRRYQLANFDKPYRRIKESFFLWTLFTISLFSQNSYLVGLIFFLILFRVISLYLWIDLISNKYKHKINSFFKINPEEIFGYILGPLKYILNKYLFRKKNYSSIINEISLAKQNYIYLNKLTINILSQYITLLIILSVYIIISPKNLFLLLFIVFILWRYILLWIVEKKLPNLPVIYDILKIFYHTPHLDETH